MPSAFEQFWTHESYAFVGHSAKAPFPKISYQALKAKGKTVYPVDPSAESIEGDKAYADLTQLPKPVQAVVIEVPKEETKLWVERAADAGAKAVWIHHNRDTPEALAAASARGLTVCHGTCAVQYVRGGFPHVIHRFLRKLSGRY